MTTEAPEKYRKIVALFEFREGDSAADSFIDFVRYGMEGIGGSLVAVDAEEADAHLVYAMSEEAHDDYLAADYVKQIEILNDARKRLRELPTP